MSRRWNSFVFLVLGALVAVGSPILPSESGDDRIEGQRFNERSESASLKTITPAEADFRANDRDWCHVNDFWTDDLKGHYTLPRSENADGTIKPIELSVESADMESDP